MLPKNILAKFLVAVGGAVFVLALAVMSLPYLLDRTSVRTQATARLSQWAGTSVEILGDFKISYFPTVTLEAGDIRIGRFWPLKRVSGISAKHLRAQINWLPLLRGRVEIGKLTLREPLITLLQDEEKKKKKGKNEIRKVEVHSMPPIARFLQRASVGKVIIVDGRLTIPNEEGSLEVVEKINATLTIPRGEVAPSGSGTFSWHQKDIKFELETEQARVDTGSATAQMKLDLNAEKMSASFSGKVAVIDNFQLKGKLDLKIPDLRRAAVWLGYSLPDGPGLKGFAAKGDFSWVGGRLEFDQANFSLDGNLASGAVSLDHDKQPPLFEGTLALPRLQLTDYFPHPNITAREHPNSAPLIRSLNLGLLNHFDADLRLSSEAIELHEFKSGRSALTLSLRKGNLVAEFAELSVFGGTGTVNMAMDIAKPALTLSLDAAFEEVAAEQLLKAISLQPIVDGKANVTAQLKADGASVDDVLKSLGGLVKIDMEEGGEAAIGLKDLIEQASQAPSEGWGPALKNKTKFDHLVTDFHVEAGQLRTRNFRIKTNGKIVTGDGTVDLTAQSMDWHVLIKGAKTAGARAGRQEQNGDDMKLLVQGAWSNPRITQEKESSDKRAFLQDSR